MDEIDVYKIDRFTEILPVKFTDHWNEILEIIECYSEFDFINDGLMAERGYLESLLKKIYLQLLIFEQWIDEGKINTKTGFKNYCNFIRTQIKQGIEE